MRLQDRVVAVAGAAGSLGPDVVAALRGEGARVGAADLAAPELEADHVAAADLGTLEGARAWRDDLVAALGRVDAVLHLVGGWRGGPALNEDALAHWRELEGPLVRTVQHASLAFLEDLRGAGARGRFAIVSQKGAQRPTAGNAGYAAAKAAAEAWTLAVAAELAGSGATANIAVVTAIGTAKPSFTAPAALADGLVFLCSDAAGAMNGQRLSLHAP